MQEPGFGIQRIPELPLLNPESCNSPLTPNPELLWWAYPLLGAVVGFLAGLLGIGGGLIMVPVLSFIFSAKDFPPQHILHLALGTGMATIVLTSLASTHSHHLHGAVRWDILRSLAPGIVAGSLAGSIFAGLIDTRLLSILFTAFAYYAATRMLLASKPVPSSTLPGRAGMLAAGSVIGAISSLAAIAGAALSVPFMIKCNVRMHEAIGTSAAIGFPIAVAGTLGYVAMGSYATLPPYSVGFVYVPAFTGIAVATMLTAPLGARFSHRTAAPHLRRIFALLLFALATRMLWEFF